MSKLTHISASGDAAMVDVSEKEVTSRTAIAEGRVVMKAETLELLVSGNAKKAMFWVRRALLASWQPNARMS